MAKEVLVYTQPGCAACAQVKSFLTQHKVEFVECDIKEDRRALLELLDRGFRGTPVTFVDGTPVVGFVPDQLEELLGV